MCGGIAAMVERAGMHKSSEEGYSLIEVLIGLMIFAVGALASGVMIVSSLHQNQAAKEKSVTQSLVTRRLEDLRSRPWFSTSGVPTLKSGGNVISNSDLRSFSFGSLNSEFSETFNYALDGPVNTSSKESFYIIMWRIEDLTDNGLDFKRITIKGIAMHWSRNGDHWIPSTDFDHVAMVFRETKSN